MKTRTVLLILVLLSAWLGCRADEGMWIPMLLKKYNIEDMQKKGFKLTAEDIYSINKASLKDAVIGLGVEGRPFHHFCTGEIISDEGLVVTNHHCSFDMIQKHSSLEHNYLRDGFWAMDKGEELSNPGITASILVRMEDVTGKILSVLDASMSEQERAAKVKEICRKLEEEAVRGTNLKANIKPYFNGNQYFMSVFKIYRDVRLVGAPASAIGKFGGDTDNWTWPRHTGDFSVLRIYAGKDNEPASYSPENKPYKPAKFFRISTRGVEEGDFTMVFGYPGTTHEYLTSYALEQLQNVEDPHKIDIRTAKLDVMNAAMESDELLRIKYASKAAGVANSWKRWQGEIKGMKRFNTVAEKQKEEEAFRQWAAGKPAYAGILDSYRKLYAGREELILASSYAMEAGRSGAEIVDWSREVGSFLSSREFQDDVEKGKKMLAEAGEKFYKDFDTETDKGILVRMLRIYNEKLPEAWIPSAVREAAGRKGISSYVERLYDRSVLGSKEQFDAFVEGCDASSSKAFAKDPAYLLYTSIMDFYKERIHPGLSRIEKEIRTLDRIWLAGLMEMHPDRNFYADANSTLRVAYGKIQGYAPKDGAYFRHYTTLKGIMEKDNPAIYDYDVPQKLREVYEKRDFGPYTQDGEVPVCFIATNHTTGGNSGSPVLDAEGNLIGLNFDRGWEGVMSDMDYRGEICRNISVDIRYVLFIIDKVAGAHHLIDEMVLVGR